MKEYVSTVFLLYTAKYFNVYDRQTQLLANENDIRCAFFVLKCLERDPNALVDHKSTD